MATKFGVEREAAPAAVAAPQMLGLLPLAALAASDHDFADHLVSGNLCISRHRLVQDEWCQFNCNSERPNCPTDTCECEGSIAMSRVPTHNDDSPPGQHAEKVAPAHEKRVSWGSMHNGSLGDSSPSNGSLANSSSAESSSSVLRTADGKQVKSLTTDNKKDWHSTSGRRNAGINGNMVLFGFSDGKLPSLAAQIVDKFYNLCKKAHGPDCSLAQMSSEELLHASELLLDNATASDDAVSVGGITDGVLTPIPPADA